MPQWCNDQEADFFLADEHYLYLFGNGALYLVDHDLQNEKVLCETPQTKTISNTWTYDALTGELYILYGDTADCTGTLYRVKDGECSVVQLPHDNIYHFQLTRDKIYYCVYDTSICYGVSPMDVRVCDYSGGRIYVTDRETHNTAEVFFDNGQDRNLPLCNRWDVIGDYVYVEYSQIMQEGGMAWFSSALYLKKVRINVPNHTIQYFRFD